MRTHLSILCMLWAFAWAGKEQSWNFDKDKPHGTPKGVQAAVGKWIVVADDTAPSKPNVLAQQAKNANPVFNVCLMEHTSFRDCEIGVKFKSISGNDDQGGGLVWRAKDTKNYYICRYNPLEENYRIYKVVEGKRTQIQSSDIQAKPGWHVLSVTVKGNQMTCSYDGKKALEIKDDTFKDTGKVGLWSKADAVTHFDDLRVKGG